MKTVQVTPAEMARRIARFRSTKPQSGYYADSGIPKEAYELMTAKTLYLMMAPETQGGPMAAKPAIVGAKGMSLIIAASGSAGATTASTRSLSTRST